MEDFFSWISKFSPSASFIIILIVLIIAIIVKSKDIIEIINWISRKKTIRSCGDCILIMFGIREKYERESNIIKHNILRSQMSYVEQKGQELVLWLTQSFQDDIEKIGFDKPGYIKTIQFGYYQEALKCAMEMVKNDLRKSFKENGFVELSDNEFSTYIKSKLKTLISIAKSYLTTYYIQNDETIVTLKYRFEKLDYNRLNDIIFDIFGHARDIVKESELKESEIKEDFKKEIDNFVKNNNDKN